MKQNRKRWTAGLLGLALALGLAACGGQGETTPTPEPTPAAEEPAFQAGTYEVTKTGINEFTLAFTFSDTALTDIQVVKENETFGTGTVAIRKMAKQAIECQTAQPDAVSGATVTSFAFRSALQEAIKEAGGDPAAFRGEIPAEQWEDTSCDLVVVGAGNAGMVAAAKGAQAGLKVILLETTDLMGGTSMGAAYLVGGSTKVQKELGVECTQEDVTKWLLTRTGETSDDLFDPEWCRLFSQKATEVLDWLYDSGIKINKIDASLSRAHVSTDFASAGNAMADMEAGMPALLDKLGVDTRLGNTATALLTENGKVTGVTVEAGGSTYQIHADNVILCTGGYFANGEMVAENFTDFADLDLPTDARKGADGSGMKMAQEAGAALANLNEGNVFPFAINVNGVELNTPLVFVWRGGLAVNKNGERFTDETAKYLTVSRALLKQPDAEAYVIFDQTVMDTVSAQRTEQVQQLMINGLIDKYDTIEDMARAHGMDPQTLKATIEHYSELVKGGADTDYNRPYYYMAGSDMTTGPYYFIDTEMCLHTSWGGIVTNIDGQVLTESGDVIEGLYAAGECTQSKVQGNGSATQGPVWGSICVETILAQQ